MPLTFPLEFRNSNKHGQSPNFLLGDRVRLELQSLEFLTHAYGTKKKTCFMRIGPLSSKEAVLELSRKVSVFTWISLSNRAVNGEMC